MACPGSPAIAPIPCRVVLPDFQLQLCPGLWSTSPAASRGSASSGSANGFSKRQWLFHAELCRGCGLTSFLRFRDCRLALPPQTLARLPAAFCGSSSILPVAFPAGLSRGCGLYTPQLRTPPAASSGSSSFASAFSQCQWLFQLQSSVAGLLCYRPRLPPTPPKPSWLFQHPSCGLLTVPRLPPNPRTPPFPGAQLRTLPAASSRPSASPMAFPSAGGFSSCGALSRASYSFLGSWPPKTLALAPLLSFVQWLFQLPLHGVSNRKALSRASVTAPPGLCSAFSCKALTGASSSGFSTFPVFPAAELCRGAVVGDLSYGSKTAAPSKPHCLVVEAFAHTFLAVPRLPPGPFKTSERHAAASSVCFLRSETCAWLLKTSQVILSHLEACLSAPFHLAPRRGFPEGGNVRYQRNGGKRCGHNFSPTNWGPLKKEGRRHQGASPFYLFL